MTHRCPVHGCPVTDLPDRLLMDRAHWAMVPLPLQSEVWRAYRGGAGVGSAELLRAQADAVAAVNARLTPPPGKSGGPGAPTHPTTPPPPS